MTEIVSRSPIRVLLVDDHPVVRAGLNSMLRKQTGIKIIGSLHGGREALEFLANEPADVMLLDLRMPNMDGIELLSSLKSNAALRSIPVIMVTTEGSQDRVLQALKLGAAGYVRKPFTAEQIREKLVGIV